MTTDQATPWSDPHARRAARVHQLTDPLGAAGFRRPRARIASETRARRILFIVALALQVGILGGLATTRHPEQEPVVTQPGAAVGGGVQVTAVTVVPHTRTRST